MPRLGLQLFRALPGAPFSQFLRIRDRNPDRIHSMGDYWVYILSNLPRRTVLYIGIANSLEVRLCQHKNASAQTFTKRYNANHLVYYEHFPEPGMAIERESQLKGWRRSKKERLINGFNPQWRDLGIAMFR